MEHKELLLKTTSLADTVCSHIRNFLRPNSAGSNAYIYIEDKLTPTNNLGFGTSFFKNYRPYLQGLVYFGENPKPKFSNRWLITELEAENFFDYVEIVFKKCVDDYASELSTVLARINQYVDLLQKITTINNAIVFDSSNLFSVVSKTLEEISNDYIVKDTDGKISQLLAVAIEFDSVLRQYIQDPNKNRVNNELKHEISDMVEFSVKASHYLSNVTSSTDRLNAFIGKNGPFNVFDPSYGINSINLLHDEFNDIRSYIKFGYIINPFFKAKISALFDQLTNVDEIHTEILNENISGLRSIAILNELNAIFLKNVASGDQDYKTAVQCYKNSVSSYFRLSTTQEYLTATTLNDQVNDLLKLLENKNHLVA